MNDEALAPSFPICEIFVSLQGEGSWTGRPMIFIRVWGCPLTCPWCDEPLHRDPKARQLMTSQEILAKMAHLAPNLPYVVLTGGEPLAMPGIAQLVQTLKQANYWVAMESSGAGATWPLPAVDWLTLSPKTPLPEAIFLAANEIKFVLSADGGSTAPILACAAQHPNVWVQPQARGNTPDPQAVARCVNLILKANGKIRLSLQTHKYIGLP